MSAATQAITATKRLLVAVREFITTPEAKAGSPADARFAVEIIAEPAWSRTRQYPECF
jgi:hypothetical protein